MFRMLIHPSSEACDLLVELFHGLYCSSSMCVGVTLWYGCGVVWYPYAGFGVVWYPYAGWSLHTDTTPPQPYHKVTPTHIEPEQYNPWNNSTNKSQAPEDGCINIRNMLSFNRFAPELFFLILAHSVYKMWIKQELNTTIMKQTAFWREINGEYIPCLKYPVPIFVE